MWMDNVETNRVQVNEDPVYLLIYMIKLLTNEILLTWAFLVLPIMFIFILLLLWYSLLIFKYKKKGH